MRSKRSRFITYGHEPGRSFLSGSERSRTLTTLTMPFDTTKCYTHDTTLAHAATKSSTKTFFASSHA